MIKPEDVNIRDWRPADAHSLSENLNDIEVTKSMRDSIPHPYTPRHARVFIGMTNCTHNLLEKAIEVNNEVVGAVSLLPQSDIWRMNAELKFYLGRKFWGRGIMGIALDKMVRYAFENFDFERIYINVFEENDKSVRVLKKAGFTYEGTLRRSVIKDGNIHNTCLYSILRDNNNNQ